MKHTDHPSRSSAGIKDAAGGVCHRAVNDFQTISNILALAQAFHHTPNDMAYAVEQRIVNLSVSYALVAQQGSVPELSDLVSSLASRIINRLDLAVDSHYEIPEMALSLRVCSPLSLWLGEIMANALVHSREKNARPKLFIEANNSDGLTIRVRDQGPGLPQGFDMGRHGGLGLKLARALAENDLRGSMEMKSGTQGLSAELIIPASEFRLLNQGPWR